MTRAARAALGLPLVLACSVACVLRGPSGVRRDVARATGAEYEREFGLTLRRVSLALARWAIGPDDAGAAGEDAAVLLHGLRKVQVGVYKVKDGTCREGGAGIDPAALARWQPVVRVHEGGETVLVLLRAERGRTRDMLIVASEADELVIVRLAGQLDGLVEDALRYGLRQAGRDARYEAARAQLDLTPR